MKYWTALWKLIDEKMLIRRAVLIYAVFLTGQSYHWAVHFADVHADKSGTEMGLIIAAVTAPISYLLKALVELYNDVRNNSSTPGNQ